MSGATGFPTFTGQPVLARTRFDVRRMPKCYRVLSFLSTCQSTGSGGCFNLPEDGRSERGGKADGKPAALADHALSVYCAPVGLYQTPRDGQPQSAAAGAAGAGGVGPIEPVK